MHYLKAAAALIAYFVIMGVIMAILFGPVFITNSPWAVAHVLVIAFAGLVYLVADEFR